jgi:tetratricopeptide (TPR) repeat protein
LSEVSQGSLIIKYEKILATHPKSQVFAPLSESYTQMGLYDKAMSVLKKGIRYNPNYTLGYISLAKCYEAQGEHQLAYSTLRPLVAQNRDNIKLQILFSKVSMNTENFDEALDTYRYLHFLNPNDDNVSSKIEEIEEKMKSEAPIEKEVNVKFDIDEINVENEDIESWEQADFSSLNEDYDHDEDEWVAASDSVTEPKVETPSSTEDSDGAMFTHTLVDLYLSQGHKDKAIDILKKILELKPNNEKALERIHELEGHVEITETPVTKDDGHSDLSASLDKLSLPEDDFDSTEEMKSKSKSENSEALDALNDLSMLIKEKSLNKISH